jgi:ribosomal protein S18 acetylase RimI-like enzyme
MKPGEMSPGRGLLAARSIAADDICRVPPNAGSEGQHQPRDHREVTRHSTSGHALGDVRFREATELDADAIAALHADSWRRHYRGAYLDSYLDGDILPERRAVWTERLNPPRVSQFTICGDLHGELIGFAHTVYDRDPVWGALLDNLHVRSDLKRTGIGVHLLSEIAIALERDRPSQSLHLWVLDQNTNAQAFYEARGGTRVETALRGPFPGGGKALGHRYFWPEPGCLVVA